MNTKRTSIIPTIFSNPETITTILKELDEQADAVLANVCILHDKTKKYAITTDEDVRSNYAIVLREHGEALETDLRIIRLNAELLTDDRLEAWVNDTTNDMGCEARAKTLDDLMSKLWRLEIATSKLKDELVGDEDALL
ncbi:hypothetical protein FB567DRAFT_128990 [Paraphoma chrysanthemicola]|uniref:Uncharacterized protein n=1 Tax=Paraphoma chrysanthemicola TaxID=798071 RepID=A0A8K0R1Z7_9PLEO|nr:hypothetical protein FB567DRAFT_128990 [Paraphoma chrysanthemicola]